MGVDSGPIDQVSDVNDRSNVAGTGINMAQRVMDCGDAGHILLSKRVAGDLGQYSRWQPHLFDLGEVEVKHGIKLNLVNFVTSEVGNLETPEKLKRARQQKNARVAIGRGKIVPLVSALLVLLAVIIGVLAYRKSTPTTPAAVTSAIPEKSIAVLPLENLSEEKENAFFADGIQDDILTSLAKIADLKVISRTSVTQYRGAGAARNLREIAQALGVENILEGSVRRAGNRVLVNVQLIDARNDRHIWAERYDRTMADSIGLQGELATEIAAALRATLAPAEKTSLEAKPTKNSEAYVLYLRARERERGILARTEDVIAAEQLYAQAIALDPDFALAHARLSMINTAKYFEENQDPARKWKGRAEAEEAVRLAPNLGEAHLALAFHLLSSEKNYPAALSELSIAEKTSPNNAKIFVFTAVINRRQNHWRESIANFQRAESLDPRNSEVVSSVALNNLLVRDWEAASAGLKRLLEIEPKSGGTLVYAELMRTGDLAAAKAILREKSPGELTFRRWDLSMLERDFVTAEKIAATFPAKNQAESEDKNYRLACVALARGDVPTAQRLFETLRASLETQVHDHPDESRYRNDLGLLYAYLGRKEDAIREGGRAVELEPEIQDAYHGAIAAANLALVYARTGESDKAVTLIERLLSVPGPVEPAGGYSITLTELRLRWEWDPLRSNPRFQNILAGPEPKTIY